MRSEETTIQLNQSLFNLPNPESFTAEEAYQLAFERTALAFDQCKENHRAQTTAEILMDAGQVIPGEIEKYPSVAAYARGMFDVVHMLMNLDSAPVVQLEALNTAC